MTISKTLTAAAGALLVAFSGASQADTEKRLINILVLPDDKDPDSVPASNDIHYRVTAELREQLRPHGYNLLDTDAALESVGFGELPDRASRRDKIEMARVMCSDGIARYCARMIVFVKTRAGVARLGVNGARGSIRLQGDVVDVRNGTSMGSWQPVRDRFSVPWPCESFCLDEAMGDRAFNISAELGDVLRVKLDDALRVLEPGYWADARNASADLRTDYVVTFRNFQFSEIRSFLDVMETQFGGDAALGESEGSSRAWVQNYTSDHNSTELVARLYQLLDDSGFDEDNFRILVREGDIEITKIVR